MNVDDLVAEARRRIEANKRRRAALAAARQRGLALRHAAKLRNLNYRTDQAFPANAEEVEHPEKETP